MVPTRLVGSLHAAPGHAAVRDQLGHLHHGGRLRVAEVELELLPHLRLPLHVARPPAGQTVGRGQCVVDAPSGGGDAHAVPDVKHVVLLDTAPVSRSAGNRQPIGCVLI